MQAGTKVRVKADDSAHPMIRGRQGIVTGHSINGTVSVRLEGFPNPWSVDKTILDIIAEPTSIPQAPLPSPPPSSSPPGGDAAS